MTISSQINKEVDFISAVLGVIFSVVLILYTCTHFNRIIYIFPGIFTLIACIFWLSIRNKSSLNFIGIESRSFYLLLTSTFFILLLCSVLSIYFNPSTYERPLIYFVLTSLMVGIVSLELFLKTVNRSLVLFQILLIGLSIAWSQLLLFPSLLGVDPWWHQMFTSEIISTHHIPEGYVYSKIPMFHSFIASVSLITALNYKFATILSVSFLQVLCPNLLIFLFCLFLFGDYKISLLASLSVVICNHQIFMSYWLIPNAFSTLFLLYILYILLKLKTKFPLISSAMSIFLMFSLIFTHTITSLFMAIILFAYCFGFDLYHFLNYKNVGIVSRIAPISRTYFVLFTVSMFAWWTFASGTISTLSQLLKWGFKIDVFDSTPQAFLSKYLLTIPLSEQLFNNMSIFLFFSLSFIGCFYMISKKYGNYNTLIFAIIGLIPLFLGFFSLISNHSILEHRWWYFAQIFLSVPFAVSIFLLINYFKNNTLKSTFLFILMVSISFLLIMSPPANIDNHIFSPKSSMTSSLMMSELQAVETTSAVWDGIIKTDEYYAGSQKITHKFESFSYELYQKNVLGLQQNLVLIRKVIVGQPFKLFSSILELDYDPRGLLNDLYFSKMYDCGSVEGYLKVQKLD